MSRARIPLSDQEVYSVDFATRSVPASRLSSSASLQSLPAELPAVKVLPYDELPQHLQAVLAAQDGRPPPVTAEDKRRPMQSRFTDYRFLDRRTGLEVSLDCYRYGPQRIVWVARGLTVPGGYAIVRSGYRVGSQLCCKVWRGVDGLEHEPSIVVIPPTRVVRSKKRKIDEEPSEVDPCPDLPDPRRRDVALPSPRKRSKKPHLTAGSSAIDTKGPSTRCAQLPRSMKDGINADLLRARLGTLVEETAIMRNDIDTFCAPFPNRRNVHEPRISESVSPFTRKPDSRRSMHTHSKRDGKIPVIDLISETELSDSDVITFPKLRKKTQRPLKSNRHGRKAEVEPSLNQDSRSWTQWTLEVPSTILEPIVDTAKGAGFIIGRELTAHVAFRDGVEGELLVVPLEEKREA